MATAEKPYPYYLVRTAFHGGGVVSRHWSREGAEAARRRYNGKGCTCVCGCCVVVGQSDYEGLPYVDQQPSPFEAARR